VGHAPSRAALAVVLTAVGCAGRARTVDSLPGAADRRPSFVLIVADDLRADVLGVAGHPAVRTPHIDRLAAEGVLFANAFVVSPQCCPARATMLTGTYGHVNGVPDNAPHRRLDVPTIAELLQDAGYETAMIGKWHIGERADPRPGFDHWAAFAGQGRYFDVELDVDGTTVETRGYSTDVLTERAVEWIAGRGDRPFLLILALKSVHQPLEPPRRDARRYARVRASTRASAASAAPSSAVACSTAPRSCSRATGESCSASTG
jgi:arylsulfatase A-like enzyme